MSPRTITLTDSLYEYLTAVSVREPEVLSRLREETASMPDWRMQVGPEQGQFMALIVELMGARRALEIGIYTGYSSICVARALPEDGRLIACDINEEWTAIARRYWREAGVAHKIEMRLAPALETLDALLDEDRAGTFDFTFIDAEKDEYEAYFERVLALTRPGGLISVDNVLWSGSVADPAKQDKDTNALRAFNKKLYQDERISLSLVPIGDGLTLALKR